MAVAAVLVAVLGDRLCRFFDVLPVVAQKDPCFGRLCRYVLTNVVGRKKIRFPIYSFQFTTMKKKSRMNRTEGRKELGGTKTASQWDAVCTGCTEQLL
jgi:hypothetical protein